MILICVIIGVLIGLITVLAMRSQLKSVHKRNDAHDYLGTGSMNLRLSTDRFLYENTTRTPKPKSNRN
jgi:uncharacterized protein